jgi:hypothetical protein
MGVVRNQGSLLIRVRVGAMRDSTTLRTRRYGTVGATSLLRLSLCGKVQPGNACQTCACCWLQPATQPAVQTVD